MKTLLTILLFATAASAQTDCVRTAAQRPPRISAETRRDFESKLDEARQRYEKEPNSADNIIWFGRRTAYLEHYKDAIFIYTEGIEEFPTDARLYRHAAIVTSHCAVSTPRSLISKKLRNSSRASPMRSNPMACRTRATSQRARCNQTSGIT